MKKYYLTTFLLLAIASSTVQAQEQNLVFDMGDGTSALFIKAKNNCKLPLVPCRAAVSGGAAGSKVGYKTICVTLESSKMPNCGKPIPQ